MTSENNRQAVCVKASHRSAKKSRTRTIAEASIPSDIARNFYQDFCAAFVNLVVMYMSYEYRTTGVLMARLKSWSTCVLALSDAIA